MADKLPNLKVSGVGLQDLHDAMKALAGFEVLVGFPEDTTSRDPGPTGSAGNEPITNAALGYIHDNGAPEANIPARPFMIPGIRDNEGKLADQLLVVAKRVLKKASVQEVLKGYERVGITAQAGIRAKINEGVPPPLAESTLRARGRKGDVGSLWELAWREAGVAPGTDIAKPLVVTGQLRNAVNFVVRPTKNRSG